MKVVRFVTEAELHIYLAGGKIMNSSEHGGKKTASVGNCFAELTDVRTPDKWLKKLFGIRPCEYCIEFDTDKFEHQLRESKSVYTGDSQYENDNMIPIEVREWCTIWYSLETHPYTRIGKCPDIFGLMQGEKIEWIKDESF